jgi:NADH:ubiquinone oxidoreductase subunit 3 (subunit A)
MFPWASTLSFTGKTGYGVIRIFLVLLIVGFIYEVIKGALNIQ